MFAKRLLKGGAKTLLLKLFNIGIMFVVTIGLTRALGAEQYGVYIFVFTLVGALSEPQFVGLRTVAVRNTAIYLDEGRFALLRGLFFRLCHFSLLGALVSAVVVLITAWFMRDKFGPESTWIFLIAAGLPLMLGINRIRDGMLRGAGTVVAGQFPKLVVRPVLLLLFIGIGWWLLSEEFDARWAMGAQVLAAVSAGFVYVYMMRRYIGAPLYHDQIEYRTREWFGGMIPLVLSGILLGIDTRIGVLLLGVLDDTAETGKFHAAFRLAELITLGHAVANILIEPMIAKLYNSGDLEKLQKQLTFVARVVFAVTLPTALVLIFAGEWLLGIFGEEFVAAAPALTILAVAQIVNAGLGSVVPILNMTNHAKDTARGVALGVVVNIVLCVVLIPRFGVEGAAWAALGSMVVWKVYLMLRVHKHLGLSTTALGVLREGRVAR